MQIRIKTAEEFRDAHVTIEIEADDHEEAVEVCERLCGDPRTRLYTAEEVGNAQASEAEFIATPLRKRIAELEREARVIAVDMDSLRRQLANETKRADKWGMTAARNHNPDGIYAREQDLARQLAQRETAVTELRQVVKHRDRELDRAADNFKISQDKNRDLRTKLEVAERERVANREWAERREKRITILYDQRDKALAKLEKISEVIGGDPTLDRLREVREILDEG